MQVDFDLPRARDTEPWLHLRTCCGDAVLCHGLRGGTYGRSNTALGVGKSRLEDLQLPGKILTGAGRGQHTPKEDGQEETTALPGKAQTGYVHALLLSKQHRTLPPPRHYRRLA